MKQKQLIFKTGCTLTLCASLALPSALAVWDDRNLLRTPAPRPTLVGTLSLEARELPTAYALYRRRQLSHPQPLEQTAEPVAAAALLREKTRALYDAGVLSETICAKALKHLSAASSASQSRQDGFSSALCTAELKPGGEMPADTVEAEWLDASGIITHYRITGTACDNDPAELLEAYRTYLGLQTLTDWQPISFHFFSDATYAQWSAQGQIYLYCCADENGLLLGASSFSQEEFRLNGNIFETSAE